MRSRTRLGDSGQGMVPLMLLVAFSALAVMFSLLVPWGAATTEKAQTQTAADAAALATIQRQREVWHDGTRAGVLAFFGLTGPDAVALTARAAGCGDGASYASRNKASMSRCEPQVAGGRSQVEFDVRADSTSDPDTGLAEATATAEMDVDLQGCDWSPPLPPVDPAPPLGTGDLTFDATLTCGSWAAEYELANVPPFYLSIRMLDPTDRDELYNDLEPRLVD